MAVYNIFSTLFVDSYRKQDLQLCSRIFFQPIYFIVTASYTINTVHLGEVDNGKSARKWVKKKHEIKLSG